MGGKQLISIKRDQRVFIAEDQQERIQWFKKKLVNLYSDIVTSPGAGVELLQYQKQLGAPYDIVFLDHDAIREFIQPGDPQFHLKTFFPVAQELARQQFNGTVIIHSFNVPGAIKMQFLLGRTAKVARIQFGMFDIEVV